MTAIKHHRVPGLDIARSLAIIFVLFLHSSEVLVDAPSWYRNLGAFGWSGVNIFFVLSGFLIGSQVADLGHTNHFFNDVKNFWYKRWFRTLPLYYFVLFIYTVIKPIVLNAPFNGKPWQFLFFLQNYTFIKDFPQSWSLCIEEHFYLLFPLCYYFLKSNKRLFALMVLLISCSFASRFYTTYSFRSLAEPIYSYYIRFPTHANFDGLCVGVFLAFTRQRWLSFASSNYRLLIGIGSLFFATTLFFSGATPGGAWAVLTNFNLAVASGLVICGVYFVRVSPYFEKIFFWIATCSYGMYLWNNMLVRIMIRSSIKLHWGLFLIIFLILTYVLSYLTFKFIETPFMNLRKKAVA